MSRWLTWERREPESDVLVVTNLWPDAELPVFGIFIKRQVESLIAAGISCDVLYVRGYRSPLVYPAAAAWFAAHSVALRRRYKLIHAHAGETGVVSRFQIGLPLLTSYCGDDLLGKTSARGGLKLESRIRSFAIRNHSRLMTATITKSAEMERALPDAVGEANTVLPNGVDINSFRPLDRAAARQQLSWDSDELIALFGATHPWIPRKRAWLAQAACEVAGRILGQPVRLEIVGSVAPEHMPVLMNAADALLMTSAIEGSPNIVKEALMCNLPVVATPAGDVETLLAGVEPSWLCQPDAEAVGSALAECLGTRRRSDGRTAAAWLADHVIASRLIEIYRSLAPVTIAAPQEAAEASVPAAVEAE